MQQVGQQGITLAARCATNKGVQSIDMHAGSTGQQPAVEGQQPTLTAANNNSTGQQPTMEGQQPALIVAAAEAITLDSSQQWKDSSLH